MNTPRHIRTVTKGRPAKAALQPVWQLLYISESLLGLAQGWINIVLQLKGVVF